MTKPLPELDPVILAQARLRVMAALSTLSDGDRRCCVVGSADVLHPCRVRCQIAWASSVNAAATRVVGGVSMASS
jgi:hypothetical protein